MSLNIIYTIHPSVLFDINPFQRTRRLRVDNTHFCPHSTNRNSNQRVTTQFVFFYNLKLEKLEVFLLKS